MTVPPPGGWPPPSPEFGPSSGPPGYGPPPGYGMYPNQPPPSGAVPPRRRRGHKWILVVLAIVVIIALTVGATLLLTRDDREDSTSSPLPSQTVDIASAKDDGPIEIIAEDPTCDAYTAINNAIAGVQKNGWGEGRAALGPAADWTPEQREQVEAVVTVMRNSTEKAVQLARETPHRLFRETYEQFIAYGRAYIASIPNYEPNDDFLASTNVSAGRALMSLCDAIYYGSTNRGLAVANGPVPSDVAPVSDPADPPKFLTSPASVCTDWIARDDRFNIDTAVWQAADPNVDGAQWTPERRSIQMSALSAMDSYADDLEALGERSDNLILRDFASAAAVYLRAYVSAGDTYTTADSFLSASSFRFGNIVTAACQAAMT